MLYHSSFSSVCLVWINTGMKHKFSITWWLGTANLGSVTFRAQWDDSPECINVQQLNFLCHYGKYLLFVYVLQSLLQPFILGRVLGREGSSNMGLLGTWSVYEKPCGTVVFVSWDWIVSPWKTLVCRCSHITAYCNSRIVVCPLWKPEGFLSIAS